MEKFKFEDRNKIPDEPEINDRDLPLQEIIPEIGPEKGKYDIAIIDGVLNDIKKERQGDEMQQKKDETKKPN